MHEGEFFDFIALGTKWVEGCYCLPNAALKGALEALTKNYKYILIDSPAGLEHLNRRITSRWMIFSILLTLPKKSFDHVERAYRIANEVKIEFKNFYVIGGFRFPEDLGNQAEKSSGS
jgi:CO dehydrogenase maturation factor